MSGAPPWPPTDLLHGASPEEFAALREALLGLAAEEPETFAALFAPDGPRRAVRVAAREALGPLRRFGLVTGEGADRGGDGRDDPMVGACRIRRRGAHLYVMDSGGPLEYFQDVWPETDALLAALEGAPPGRLLDLGTGTGIVAIEAAARGHAVVATDLYESALQLACFNAALNGVASAVELRRGHLLDPVAGERFDLILTAPHYTRLADQLRLEVLRAAPDHLRPGGRLVVATVLEWEAGAAAAPLPVVETVLRPLAERGFQVEVAPLRAEAKRGWFVAPLLSEPVAGLVARHRFVVTITHRPPGRLAVERPAEHEPPRQVVVPLRRLAVGTRPALPPLPAAVALDGARAARRLAALPLLPLPPGACAPRPGRLAVISTPDDAARLREVLAGIRAGHLVLSGALPTGLLDACRYGARPCLSRAGVEGAAGAILDGEGGIRPCTHGRPVARFSDSMAEVGRRLAEEAERAAARRGCARCPAAAACSRCLFPHPLDEASYCELIRAQVEAWPLLGRLLGTLARLPPAVASVELKLRPGGPLLAAALRPGPAGASWPAEEERVRALGERWRAAETWILRLDGGPFWLAWHDGEAPTAAEVRPEAAALGELVGEGADAAGLLDYLRAARLPPRMGQRALRELAQLLPC